jgi:hypothetical protein
LLNAFEAGTLPEAVCGTRVTELGAEVGGLRRRREELVAAVEDEPPPGLIPLDDICADVIGLLDADGDAPTRKALVRLLIEEIRVDSREAIFPTFRVPPERPVRIVDRVVHRTVRLDDHTLGVERAEDLHGVPLHPSLDVGPKKALADGWFIHLSGLDSASAVSGQLRLPDIPSDASAAGCAARSRSRCQ